MIVTLVPAVSENAKVLTNGKYKVSETTAPWGSKRSRGEGQQLF